MSGAAEGDAVVSCPRSFKIRSVSPDMSEAIVLAISVFAFSGVFLVSWAKKNFILPAMGRFHRVSLPGRMAGRARIMATLMGWRPLEFPLGLLLVIFGVIPDNAYHAGMRGRIARWETVAQCLIQLVQTWCLMNLFLFMDFLFSFFLPVFLLGHKNLL